MYKQILVPIDGSTTSLKALDAAIAMAKESGGRLRLLHLLEEIAYFGADTYGVGYTELLQATRDADAKLLSNGIARAMQAGVNADSQLNEEWKGGLGEAAAKAALDWKADLIVIGTHGRRGVNRFFMGSGAEQVIRRAPVPVLVIRAEEAAAT